MKASQVSMEHLITDLRAVARDSEQLLKTSASDASEAAADVRDRLATSLQGAKETCQRLQDKTVATAKKADRVIHDHPYSTAGVAFGLGLIVGALACRRARSSE